MHPQSSPQSRPASWGGLTKEGDGGGEVTHVSAAKEQFSFFNKLQKGGWTVSVYHEGASSDDARSQGCGSGYQRSADSTSPTSTWQASHIKFPASFDSFGTLQTYPLVGDDSPLLSGLSSRGSFDVPSDGHRTAQFSPAFVPLMDGDGTFFGLDEAGEGRAEAPHTIEEAIANINWDSRREDVDLGDLDRSSSDTSRDAALWRWGGAAGAAPRRSREQGPRSVLRDATSLSPTRTCAASRDTIASMSGSFDAVSSQSFTLAPAPPKPAAAEARHGGKIHRRRKVSANVMRLRAAGGSAAASPESSSSSWGRDEGGAGASPRAVGASAGAHPAAGDGGAADEGGHGQPQVWGSAFLHLMRGGGSTSPVMERRVGSGGSARTGSESSAGSLGSPGGMLPVSAAGARPKKLESATLSPVSKASDPGRWALSPRRSSSPVLRTSAGGAVGPGGKVPLSPLKASMSPTPDSKAGTVPHHLYAAGGGFVSEKHARMVEEFAALKVQAEDPGTSSEEAFAQMTSLLIRMHGLNEHSLQITQVEEILKVSWEVGIMTEDEALKCRQTFMSRRARALLHRAVNAGRVNRQGAIERRGRRNSIESCSVSHSHGDGEAGAAEADGQPREGSREGSGDGRKPPPLVLSGKLMAARRAMMGSGSKKFSHSTPVLRTWLEDENL